MSAITSNEVTYENEGINETLTNTIDALYSELKEYRTNGSVTSSEMLEGYTGYSKGKLVSGSIPSKGSTTYTPGVNNQVITKGQYLSENQVILGDSNLKAENIKSGTSLFGINGTYTSDATANSSEILSGKTAYVNGNKVIGTHPKVISFGFNYNAGAYDFGYDNHKYAFLFRVSIREHYPNYQNITRENIFIDIARMPVVVYGNKNIGYLGGDLTIDYDNTNGDIILSGLYNNIGDVEYGVQLGPRSDFWIRVAIIE